MNGLHLCVLHELAMFDYIHRGYPHLGSSQRKKLVKHDRIMTNSLFITCIILGGSLEQEYIASNEHKYFYSFIFRIIYLYLVT